MIEKIKSVCHGFAEGVGPNKVTTLGIKIYDRVYIFGKFYEGAYEDPEAGTELIKVENDINRLVRLDVSK